MFATFSSSENWPKITLLSKWERERNPKISASFLIRFLFGYFWKCLCWIFPSYFAFTFHKCLYVFSCIPSILTSIVFNLLGISSIFISLSSANQMFLSFLAKHYLLFSFFLWSHVNIFTPERWEVSITFKGWIEAFY